MAIASIVFDPLDGSEALVSASTADSKAVIADSKAVVADSIADEALDDASDALLNASTADSKAVIADSIADEAKALADSAIGSEPGVGDYKVTDIKRDTDGSLVVEYDDSQITE